MEIIIYQGADLDSLGLERMAQKAAASVNAQAELHLQVCQTHSDLARHVHQAALQELASRERYFPFKSTEGVQLLQLSQVLYFKSRGHRIIAVMTDGRELAGRTLRVPTSKILEPLVETGRFCRTFRSTIVNKTHIAALTPSRVRLDNGAVLNISRKYYQAFLRENQEKDPD